MALTEKYLALMTEMELKRTESLAAALTAGGLSILAQFRQTRLPTAPNYAFLPAITAELRSIWLSTIQRASDLFIEEFSDGFPAATKGLTETLLDSFISGLRPRTAQQIVSTTERQIRDMMAGGLAAGESADAVYSDLLARIPETSSLRALLITRTEVHAATQFASWQLARRSLVRLDKIWNIVPDEKTRDFGELGRISQFNHRAMDGARVGLNDAFEVPVLGGGREYLMFPGDPRGSAGNVINCRCIQTYERA